MANRSLSIPDHLLPAFALVARHGQQLPLLREVIEALDPVQRTPGAIARQFAKKLNISVSDARDMINQLMTLHTLQATFDWSPSETFDSMLSSLESDASSEWKAEHLDAWKAARKEIEEIAATTHPLYFVQKALRLKFDHQHILRDANVLVDARPLFDEPGRQVVQWSIDYVLEIEYHDGARTHHLYATLDAGDVAKLKAQCERAQTKTITLKAALTETGKRPVIVTGEVSDD